MDPAEGAPLPLETGEETKSVAAQPHQAGDRPPARSIALVAAVKGMGG